MNLSEIFIRRPVMTLLVMLGILTFGVVAYRQLPVAQLPNVDFPTIQVRAELPGASPETMAAAVATPLEKQFSTIAGVDQMTSSSTQGTTQITLQFALDRDIDAAAQDVQTAISLARRQLPRGHVGAAVLPQGQSGRHADLLPRRHLRHAAAVSRQRVRRDAAWRSASRW